MQLEEKIEENVQNEDVTEVKVKKDVLLKILKLKEAAREIYGEELTMNS